MNPAPWARGGTGPAEARALWGSRAEVAAALKEPRSWAIFLHANPDGDSIGSSLALGEALEAMGRDVTFVYDREFPRAYRFLEGADRFVHWRDALAMHQEGRPFEGALVPDVADPSRLGDALPLGRRIPFWVNIDHHPTNPGFGQARWVDPARGCTGEMALDVIDDLGVSITPAMAQALYTAILTDTGSFRFSNTTPDTHRNAARLMELGAQPQTVSEHVYESMPLPSIRLLAAALSSLEVDRGGVLAWITVSREMVQRCRAAGHMPEGLANFARSVEGVELALLFFEEDDGSVRVGFRSKRRVDVGRLASQFGGGGHARAAGCTVPGPLDEARTKVLAAARETLAGGPVPKDGSDTEGV